MSCIAGFRLRPKRAPLCSSRYAPRVPRFTGDASTDAVSRRWSSSSQASLRAECYDCLAQRDPRTVRPTSANRSFQRRGPGAARRSALSWLSPHPHRWHARFTPRLPRKPSTGCSSWGTFPFHSPRRSATSDAPVIARLPRAWLSPCPRLPHDLGRFHAEPVKDIRADTTRSAFRRWMPSSGLQRSRDFAAAIRLAPPFHLPRCHPRQASSPSTSAEHEPLETSSNGSFIESRRRPPTSAVRPSSRARSRALDPRRAFAR